MCVVFPSVTLPDKDAAPGSNIPLFTLNSTHQCLKGLTDPKSAFLRCSVAQGPWLCWCSLSTAVGQVTRAGSHTEELSVCSGWGGGTEAWSLFLFFYYPECISRGEPHAAGQQVWYWGQAEGVQGSGRKSQYAQLHVLFCCLCVVYLLTRSKVCVNVSLTCWQVLNVSVIDQISWVDVVHQSHVCYKRTFTDVNSGRKQVSCHMVFLCSWRRIMGFGSLRQVPRPALMWRRWERLSLALSLSLSYTHCVYLMIASANVCNVVLMRYSELTEGISVHDDQGTVVGTSQVAARHVSSHQCTQARYSNTHIYTVFCILYTFILYIYILYTWLLFPLFDCFLLCTSLWIKVSAKWLNVNVNVKWYNMSGRQQQAPFFLSARLAVNTAK